jgi:hypothetical protein
MRNSNIFGSKNKFISVSQKLFHIYFLFICKNGIHTLLEFAWVEEMDSIDVFINEDFYSRIVTIVTSQTVNGHCAVHAR